MLRKSLVIVFVLALSIVTFAKNTPIQAQGTCSGTQIPFA